MEGRQVLGQALPPSNHDPLCWSRTLTTGSQRDLGSRRWPALFQLGRLRPRRDLPFSHRHTVRGLPFHWEGPVCGVAVLLSLLVCVTLHSALAPFPGADPAGEGVGSCDYQRLRGQ